MPDLPEHVSRNRSVWNAWAEEYVRPGRRNWSAEEPTWGIWGIPESDVGMLDADLEGRDAIELGCGTGYVSAWLARRGARPVGIDNSPAQLETARAFQEEFGLEFPLHLGDAEERLLRPYFGMHRFEWPEDESVEFHLPHGELIALLRDSGFEIEELRELQPPEDATTTGEYVTLDWARKWPSEEVWKVRKRPSALRPARSSPP